MILVTFPLLHGYAWAHQTFAKPTTLHTHHAHHHSCAPLPYLSYPLNPFLSLLSTIHSTTTTYIFHTHRFPSFISTKPITTTHSHVQLITSFTTAPTSLLAHCLPLPIQTNSLVHGHPHFPTSSYAPYPPLTVDFISTLFICLRVISTHLQFESMLLKAEIW